MKQLLVICVLFVQFVGISSARAETITHYDNGIPTEKGFSISSEFHLDHSADISKTICLDHTALKARYQRIEATAVSFDNSINALAILSTKHSDNYTSPSYLPLIRLLLYPKHYFW